MPSTGSRTLRLGRALAWAFVVAGTFVARGALGYGEQGFYTGAYALVGEGGCAGAAMGVNPSGGCTPGVDALIRSEAFATGIQGEANHTEAIADLALSRLLARSIFPDGAGNNPAAEANLTETFTVEGDLPGDATVTVALRMNSVLTNDPGYGTVQARLYTEGSLGSGTALFYRYPNCAWAGGAPCSTAAGWIGHELVRTVTVNDANRSFRVDASLLANGSGSPSGHSTDAWGKIAVVLPDGLRMTTASGVWRVPEPSQAMTSLCGVAALGGASAWRHRRRAA